MTPLSPSQIYTVMDESTALLIFFSQKGGAIPCFDTDLFIFFVQNSKMLWDKINDTLSKLWGLNFVEACDAGLNLQVWSV